MKPTCAFALLTLFTSTALALSPQGVGSFCVPEEAELVDFEGGDVDALGYRVAIFGDTAMASVAGRFGASSSSRAVLVFRRQGTTWTREAKLMPSVGSSQDLFGASVALHEDTAIIGAPGNDYRGAAYVFVRRAGVWAEAAKLTVDDGFKDQGFGGSVAIYGDTAVVGAHAPLFIADRGAAYVFVRQGNPWTLQSKIEDPTTGKASADQFGFSVSISGETIVVGEPKVSTVAGFSGAAHVFVRRGIAWEHQAMLQPFIGGYKHWFGWSVSISGDRIGVSSPTVERVYVFERSGEVWSQTARLTAGDSVDGSCFGCAIAISGDVLVVGAEEDDPNGYHSGSAYVFHRAGPHWLELAKLTPEHGAGLYEEFGRAVAVHRQLLLVGRPDAAIYNWERGTVHVFKLPPPSGDVYCHCAVGPCGNPGPEAGCANATGRGASLIALGSTVPDEVSLLADGCVPGGFALVFQADSPAQFRYGDGLRCVAGGLVALSRVPTVADPFGVVGYGHCFGDTPISVTGGVVSGSGVTRYYQCWYRDPTGPCGRTFNLTNGVAITW